MLSMFGFIKKSLEDKGQLIAKYREWKNTLYQDMNKFADETIPAMIRGSHSTELVKAYYLFSPINQECPVDLTAKDWSFQMKINVTNLGSSSGSYSQLALDVGENLDSNSRGLVRVKMQGPGYDLNEYETNPGSPTIVKRATSGVQVGANYLKMNYKASTNTISMYYSKNGSSWTSNGSYKVKSPSKMKRIWIWQGHTDATMPISSVKFTYDGEVLFGK